MATIAEHITNLEEGAQGISCKLSFLLGVPYTNIKNDPDKVSCYKKLEANKPARIIRNLSILRTDIMKNYEQLRAKIKIEGIRLLSTPTLVSQQAITALDTDQITWYRKSNILLEDHIIEINRLISDRINNIRGQFPLWLDWNYVRELFLMPDGYSRAGVKAEGKKFRGNLSVYPYQVYLNWKAKDTGNILYDDRKIVSVLYEQHDERFDDLSVVCDIGSFVKDSVHRFIDESKKLVMAVDCENVDPYKLCAALRGLSKQQSAKITKILLFDDINTQNVWRAIEGYLSIPVEYILVERINKHKSLVDVTLTATVSKEHYFNNVDSFILVSSDSDYWGMITSLSSARFLVMMERDNSGKSIKTAFKESGTYHCYLDDFYSGNCNDIKYGVLLQAIRKELGDSIKLNLNTVLDNAIYATRIDMGELERQQFYDTYVKRKLHMNIDDDGNVQIVL